MAYTGSGRDTAILESGDMQQVIDRIDAIFGNRGVDAAAGGSLSAGAFGSYGFESGDDRLARIARQVLAGDRTFQDVRESVDRIAAQPDRTSASTPFPRLSVGATGAHVRNLQTELRQAGYDVEVDGTYGEQTAEAVRQLQSQMGARQDGVVGAETWRMMNTHAASPINAENRFSTAPSDPAGMLAPLSATDLADLTARRRAADALLQDALARAEADRARINSNTETALGFLGEQFAGERDGAMRQMAARSNARQPRVAGRQMRSLRDQEARERGMLQSRRTDQLASLDRMASEAETRHGNSLSLIDADEARRRSELGRLVPEVG